MHRGVTHLVGLGTARLGPHKILDRQHEVRCTVRAELLLTLNQFIQLQTHQARHSGRGGGDGRDDPSSDELTL